MLNPAQVLDLGARLGTVLEAVRANPARVRDHAAAVATLHTDATTANLGAVHAPAAAALASLRTLTTADPVDPPAVQALLAGSDPALARPTHLAFTAFSPWIQEVKAGVANSGRIGVVGSSPRITPAISALTAEETADLTATGSLVTARVHGALRALERAYAHHRAGALPVGRVVLVFVGSEFYFRRSDGPCTRDERDQVLQSLRNASWLYPDVLLMPGTIVSGEHYPDPNKRGRTIWVKVTNTAPVIWNGNLIHSVDKNADAGTTAGVEPAYSGDTSSSSQTRGTGPCHFRFGDLRVATEICADHDAGRARQQATDAELHLVCGWGQAASPDRAAIGNNLGFCLSADSGKTGGVMLAKGAGPGRPVWQNADANMDEHGVWRAPPNAQAQRDEAQLYWNSRSLGRAG